MNNCQHMTMVKSKINFSLTLAITTLLIHVHFVEGDFIEQPKSLNATLNSTRIFPCRVESGGAYGWRINGTTITPGAPPEGIEVIPIVGGSTLSVYCDEGRNMSTVMCLATLEDLAPLTIVMKQLL